MNPRPQAPSSPRGAPRLASRAREHGLRRRLIDRDERALAELIDLASPWLLGVTQAMLSDRDEAEEVVMETLTIAWNRIGATDDEHQGIMPWLLRIARNRAIDRLRRRRRWRHKQERLAVMTGDEAHQSPAEPNEAALPGWHVHEAVQAALAQLPSEQRQAVHLAFYQGHTHSEIAAELGIPMGTVKTRLRLAYDKLRTALTPLRDWVI